MDEVLVELQVEVVGNFPILLFEPPALAREV
jgi:hypothetical protein